MINVWFSVPAFKRFEVSEITFRQWSKLREAVSDTINLQVVVVADDFNLDIAEKYGFDTLVRGNYRLGERYNDGFEYAYNHGADFVTDSGSRNLIHPDLLLAIPWEQGKMFSGSRYALLHGEKMSVFDCNNIFGRGPMFVPRNMLDVFSRPVDDDAFTLILHTICGRLSTEFDLNMTFTNVHDFQYVGILRPEDPFVTSLDDYVNRWGVLNERNIREIEGFYDRETVDAVLELFR